MMKDSKKQNQKPSLAQAYKNIKGFGEMPEPEKKKVKVSRFLKVLGRDK